LATFTNRIAQNRTNAYSQPEIYKELAAGLPSFDTHGCTGISAILSANTPNDPIFNQRIEKGNVKKATFFFEALKKYAFAGQENSASIPAPACTQQAPFDPINGGGPATTYQHTFEQGE
jgi:hypothetical protein